ncbi:cobalamin B12-binding domain-containing protein [Rudaeicoccus suwonensis]|nr:B12-binding domain-containing protein [Rudaeicoccus suwonensis]
MGTIQATPVSAEIVLETRNDVFDAILGLDGDLLHHDLVAYHDRFGSDSLVADVLIPVLRNVGDMWEQGQLGVLHEHHASGIIRSVIGTIRRPAFSTSAAGNVVVLACPPRELHDLPNHLFSLMLLDRGLAPVVLGANTPWKALTAALHSTGAVSCVLSGVNPVLIHRYPLLSRLASITPIHLAGPLGDGVEVAGVHRLSDDWRAAADDIAAVKVGVTAAALLTPVPAQPPTAG